MLLQRREISASFSALGIVQSRGWDYDLEPVGQTHEQVACHPVVYHAAKVAKVYEKGVSARIKGRAGFVSC